MTDHLEPYRRMARSIRFFPPSALTQPIPQPITAPVTPSSVAEDWAKKTSSNASVKPIEPPIDPSEHAAALVHEAVWKPTVLPATYTIPENIGDRISRLAASRRPVALVIQPTMPQPALNGTALHTSESYELNTDRLVYDAQRQVYALASTIVAEPVEVEATPEEPLAVEVEATTPEEPLAVEVEATTPEEPLAVEVEATTPEEPLAVVEATTPEEPPVEETTPEEPLAVVEELVKVPETVPEIITDPDIPVEAEDVQPPTLLEKVSSVIEAVSTAFMNPEVARKDNETVTEPAQLHPEGIETPATDSNEPEPNEASATLTEPVQTPSLLDRVSAVVEAVATTLKEPDAEKKKPAVVESKPAAVKALDSKTTTAVTCPACGSSELRKNGRRQGKQRYACKDCGRQFAMADAEIEDKQKPESASVEVSLVKESQPVLDVPEIASNTKSGSKKVKAKGFGASKKSK